MRKLIVVALCVCFLAGCVTQSEGERVGTISKFSKRGIIVSTWEGDVILGGTGASGNKDNTWSFTVEDEGLVEKVKGFHRSGNLVVLSYRQEMFVGGWRGDTHYFITNIEFAKDEVSK